MATSTNTPVVITLFTFYIAIGVLFGLIGNSLQATALSSTTVSVPSSPGLLSFLQDIFGFFGSIFFTISNLPGWANTLIFGPGVVVAIYLIFSYLRGTG